MSADVGGKKKSSLITACLLIGFVIIVLTELAPSPGTRPEEIRTGVVASTGASIEILRFTARSLFDAYESNEVATDNSLKGRVVEVTGQVQSIDKSVWNAMFVSLRTKNEFMPTQMHMDPREEAKVATLRRGQTAVFRCPKMKRWVGSPMGESCVLMTSQ